MKLIDSIEVNYFRSMKNVSITKMSDLSVISGANDSGKSNILHALRLFFNNDYNCDFDLDFNKERLQEVRNKLKAKQVIRITITFIMPKSSSVLPPKVKVTRVWDRSGRMVNEYNDLESKMKKKSKREKVAAQRQFSAFQNKLEYVYVPAVRDENFFSRILQFLQESVMDAEQRKKKSSLANVAKYAESFNKELTSATEKLNMLFKDRSGIETSLSVPTSTSELFRALQISTRHDEHDIPLKLRGQGIRMQYVPTILSYIADISNKYYVWGFDEPENSCEYKLSQKLACEFRDSYAKEAQIIAVSHSFSFVSMKGENVSRYRVIRKTNKLSSEVVHIGERDLCVVEEDLGVLEINEQLKNLYEGYRAAEAEARRVASDVMRPGLLFEGKTDCQHFSLSYKSLFSRELENNFIVSGPDSNGADGAKTLSQFLKNHVGRLCNNNTIIAIFDHDQAGRDQMNGAIGGWVKKKFGISGIVYKHPRRPVYAIVLVPPENRKGFVSIDNTAWCHLETELLYDDTVISIANRKYVYPNDDTVFGYKGKKANFLAKVEDNNSVNYTGFLPTWELIHQLCGIRI